MCGGLYESVLDIVVANVLRHWDVLVVQAGFRRVDYS